MAGDGRGPAALALAIQPRDLSRGVFRSRSTPSGSPPTDADLRRIIGRGIRGTAMPAFSRSLDDRDLLDLVAFVRTLSARPGRAAAEPVVVGRTPRASRARLVRGRTLYREMQCGTCHGERGRGDGPAAPTLTDDQGRPIEAYDFTSGRYKYGGAARDVYRTLVTGLDGSPMPSYADVLPEEEDRWNLALYVISLRREPSGWERLLGEEDRAW